MTVAGDGCHDTRRTTCTTAIPLPTSVNRPRKAITHPRFCVTGRPGICVGVTEPGVGARTACTPGAGVGRAISMLAAPLRTAAVSHPPNVRAAATQVACRPTSPVKRLVHGSLVPSRSTKTMRYEVLVLRADAVWVDDSRAMSRMEENGT